MSKNIHQVYVANPITSNAGTDLMYFGQSPYGATNDAAMTFANFSVQFALPGANSNITSMTGLTGALKAPTAVQDSSGNNVLQFSSAGAAVNYIDITNALTTNSPTLAATGSDSSVNLSLATKNGDFLLFDITSTKAPILKLFNAARTFFNGLQANASLASNVQFQLPAADGATSGCGMQTNASGVLSFTSNPVITKVAVQTFTSNGTYTPTTGMKFCIIECLGGGGGGGGVANSGNSAGGGGGGGGYIKVLCTAAQIGGSQSITVGAAANGGVAGNNNGTAGNASSVGSLFSANGGSAGSGSAGNATATFGVNGGAGGTTSLTTGTLLVSIPGQQGQVGQKWGSTGIPVPPNGGNSYLGFGGVTTNAAASNGTSAAANSGGGGSGGFGSASNQSGGNGGSGIVIITEYISA